MARKTKKSTSSPFSWRYVLFHPALWFLIATGGMMVGAMQLWQTHYETLIDLPEYQLSSQQIQVNTAPNWVRVDLEQEIFDDYHDTPSLLDQHLVPLAVDKLKSYPWVEEVNRVEKVDSGLAVDVTYRQPAGLVEIRATQVEHVIDRQAVLMDPKVMDSVSPDSLLRISVAKPAAESQVLWSVWDDHRIVDAAEICGIKNALWKQMGCYRIVSWDPPGSEANHKPFEIWPRTAKGTTVVWGSAPGKEKQGEASAAEKLQALRHFLSLQPTDVELTEGQKIDVRTGTAVVVKDMKSARQPDFFDRLK